jgi:hypothetical protein
MHSKCSVILNAWVNEKEFLFSVAQITLIDNFIRAIFYTAF